jgi:hypothetical protein
MLKIMPYFMMSILFCFLFISCEKDDNISIGDKINKAKPISNIYIYSGSTWVANYSSSNDTSFNAYAKDGYLNIISHNKLYYYLLDNISGIEVDGHILTIYFY